MLIFKQLYDSTIKYFGLNRTMKDVDAKLVDIIPNVSAGIITFRFRVKSQMKRNEGYNTWLQFYNIQFSDHPMSSTSVKILEKDTGKPLYFERISLTEKAKKNYVRVRCSCKDFRFRFAWEDRDNQCLFGGPPAKYTPKPGSNRPPVNPNHVPGICKHLYQCAHGMQRYFTR